MGKGDGRTRADFPDEEHGERAPIVLARLYTHARTHTRPPFQSVKRLALQAVLVNAVLMAVINETCSLAGTLISKSLRQRRQGSERTRPHSTSTRKKKNPGKKRKQLHTIFTRVRSSRAVKKKIIRERSMRSICGREI